MPKQNNFKLTIKRTISWFFGLPAGLIVVSELQDLTFWWIQFVALVVLFAILHWNSAFEQTNQY